MASGGPRTLKMTGKYGDGWLPIGYTPELFEDHKNQIVDSMNENGRTEEEKQDFQMALDIELLSDDEEHHGQR